LTKHFDQFQLRFSPSLASKPKSAKKSSSKPFDPFETPQKGLFVTDLGQFHYLVLNKFPVIPDHFILATTEFKEQTDLLEEQDIEATYKCIKQYREVGKELFGFFNSGENSGASQRHRHLQFLPVDSMRSGLNETSQWSVLADRLLEKTGTIAFYCTGLYLTK
jgi:ATP adenylyltransferase